MNRNRDADPRAQAAARRWGFLDVWLNVLKEHLSYDEREEADEETMHSKLQDLVVYLPWPPDDTIEYRRELLRLREALELVGLMLEMDKYAWLLLCDPEVKGLEKFDPNDYNDDELRPHFLFKAFKDKEGARDGITSINACAQLLAVMDPNELSYAYEQARRRILHEIDDRRRLHGFQIPITLFFYPTAMSQARASQYIAQAKTLVTTVRSQQNIPPGHNEYPFKLQNVFVHTFEFKLYRDHERNNVRGLVKHVLDHGVRISEVVMNLSIPDARALGKLLLTITHARATSRPRLHAAKVDSLMVTDNVPTAFICVCSALASSTTLTRVHAYDALTDDDAGKRADKWKWLGFALLSRASRSSVQELHIEEGKLTLSDAEALSSTAKSPHPFQEFSMADSDDELGSEEGDESDEPKPSQRRFNAVDREVKLARDAKVRLFVVDGKERTLLSLGLSSSTYFPVITDNTEDEWMEVLIPGYGCAWVACDSIVDVATIKMDPESRTHGLKTLRLTFNECERGALASMVRTMGQSLVVLSISSKKAQDVQSDDVLAILDSCPNLKMLHVECAKIGTIHHFIRAYEENQCRITSLSLVNVEVSNASLCNFAQVLADPAHQMTKTLTEFRYSNNVYGCHGDVHRPDERGLLLFLNMLRSNRPLSFFEVALADEYHDQFAHRFKKLDGRRFSSQPADLPLQAKLALLSCVSVVPDNRVKRLRPSRDQDNVPVLSRAIIAAIFGFARKRVVRNVSVVIVD